MSLSDAELEVQLKDAGKALLDPPSSIDELLSLLDRVEELLGNVEQSPSASLQDAFLPAMKALISDKLLRHSDMDVKVSAVSCISQITRITAPDAPYDDDHMKEIFQLSVAAFEKLSQFSGHCYTKALSILDVIAKVRASLIMLDLECDALIFEMFQHFLNHVRSNHPDAVFSSMEAVMSLILDESEDIPLDLISLLLDSVKKENQDTSPISWKLGESVITNCAVTLKPYLAEAVKSLGINVDDYAQIVASICQNGTEDLKHKSATDAKDILENEDKLKNAGSNEPSQGTKGLASDVVCPRKTNQTADDTSKSTSNGAASTRKDGNSSQKLQRGFLIKHSKGADSGGVAERNSSLSLKADKTISEPDSIQKMRGVQKLNSSEKTEEGNLGRAYSRTVVEPNGSPMVKIDKYESDPDSVPRKRGQKRTSLKKLEKGHSLRADSRDIAETNSSLSIKEEKSEHEQDSAVEKKGQKAKSLVNTEEGHSKRADTKVDSAPKILLSVKSDKSENEPNPVPKKRGRKPNSLMNPEEGYEHSWTLSERKTLGHARYRKSREKSTGSSLSGNSVSRKAASASTLENVAEPAGLQSELDETIGDSPSEDRKGAQLKKKGATLNPEADTKFPSALKAELLNSEAEEKTPKKEPEDTVPAEEKQEENSTKLGVSTETNDETAIASARMEAEDPRDPEEKLQQSTVKPKAANVKKNSSVKSGRKKREKIDDSPNRDVSEESGLKNTVFETGIKSSKEDGSYFGKSGNTIFKRKRVIGKEEASESPDFGELIVGRRIKVWWPMDRKFYEGVIDSYDPIKKRHKVCYIDGDVEILNMKNQRWETVGNDALADEGEKADLPGLDISAPILKKEKQKTKSDQKKRAKDDSSSESNLQKGKRKTKSNQKSLVKKSSQEKEEKADYSPESNPRRGKAKPDQVKQAKRSGQAKARSSSKSNPRSGKLKTKSDDGAQEKKSNEGKQAKDDSSSESNPQKGKRKRKSDKGKQAEKSDESKPLKAESVAKGNPKKGKRIQKSDESKQAQAEASSESNPQKGIQKRKPDGKNQADNADESKQAKADTSSERIEVPAPESNLDGDIKSVDDAMLKDDNQISAGDLEADTLKTTADCKKASLDTVALTEGKSPEADAGFDSEECANKLVEMSKGGKEE